MPAQTQPLTTPEEQCAEAARIMHLLAGTRPLTTPALPRLAPGHPEIIITTAGGYGLEDTQAVVAIVHREYDGDWERGYYVKTSTYTIWATRDHDGDDDSTWTIAQSLGHDHGPADVADDWITVRSCIVARMVLARAQAEAPTRCLRLPVLVEDLDPDAAAVTRARLQRAQEQADAWCDEPNDYT